MKQLEVAEFKNWIDSKKHFQLVDVREKWEQDICRLESAIHQPLTRLQFNPIEFDKSLPIVAYCHHGSRSQFACLILERMGYQDVYNLVGGIDAYAATVDQTTPRY